MQTSADSNKPQHTPGPWRKIKGTGVIAAADCHVAKVGDFTDAELLPFNRERWEADGDFIVRACNSHAALVEALEAVLACPMAAVELARTYPKGTPESSGWGGKTIYEGPSNLDLVKAALASAKES